MYLDQKYCIICGIPLTGQQKLLCRRQQCLTIRRRQTETREDIKYQCECVWCGKKFKSYLSSKSVCEDPICRQLQELTTRPWFYNGQDHEIKRSYLKQIRHFHRQPMPYVNGCDPIKRHNAFFSAIPFDDIKGVIRGQVAEALGVPLSYTDLRTKREPVISARKLCYYIGRKFYGGSSTRVGFEYGRKHHANCLHLTREASQQWEYSGGRLNDKIMHKIAVRVQDNIAEILKQNGYGLQV